MTAMEEIMGRARTASNAELTELIGELARAQAIAMARLTVPVPTVAPAYSPDELLTAEEAARRLGVSKDWLYHAHSRLPFTKHVGRSLRFSAQGIEWYIKSKIS